MMISRISRVLPVSSRGLLRPRCRRHRAVWSIYRPIQFSKDEHGQILTPKCNSTTSSRTLDWRNIRKATRVEILRSTKIWNLQPHFRCAQMKMEVALHIWLRHKSRKLANNKATVSSDSTSQPRTLKIIMRTTCTTMRRRRTIIITCCPRQELQMKSPNN